MPSHLAHRANGPLQVAHVVHGIEDAEHVHPVGRGALHEAIHHVVRIVPVAKQVLPAQQHLLGRFGHGRLELAQPLPRILPQIADAGIEGGSAPGLHGPKAHLVELAGDGQHVLDAHACGQQALVRIAQRQFGQTQRGGVHGREGGWVSAGADAGRRRWRRLPPRRDPSQRLPPLASAR